MKMIVLPIEGGRASFDSEGVRVKPWFSATSLLIPWSNILFVSPIPSIRRTEFGWVTYDGIAITGENMRKRIRFHELALVLKDRRAVFAQAHFLTKAWLRVNIMLKPLFDADDKPNPSQGCLKLRLSPRKIRKSFPVVEQVLNTIEIYSRFDLLCTTD